MKLVCVDNEPNQSLTIGKEYKVIKKIEGIYDTAVEVVNDSGHEEYYSIRRFNHSGVYGKMLKLFKVEE